MKSVSKIAVWYFDNQEIDYRKNYPTKKKEGEYNVFDQASIRRSG